MLRLRDVTVRRGSARVVEGLTWSIGAGEPAWIVGPNGAGKSSLLRVAAGLAPPAAGEVMVAAGRRPLYFHAETALPPASTVADWERLARGLLPPGGEAPTPLRPPLSGRRRLGRLSTGERKRLLLDVLLRTPGEVLLLDEPYAHLSPEAREILTTLLEARAMEGVVVIASNQLADVAGRKGLRLEGGRAAPLDRGLH